MTETSLAKLDRAVLALSQARTLDDILAIRDIADAARVYAQAAQRGLQAMNYAAEVKLRAERKAGAFLAELERAKPGPKPKLAADSAGNSESAADSAGNSEYSQTLKDTGVTERRAQEWQKEATVPDGDFEAFVTETNETGNELTKTGLLKLAAKNEPKPEKEPKPEPTWLDDLTNIGDVLNEAVSAGQGGA